VLDVIAVALVAFSVVAIVVAAIYSGRARAKVADAQAEVAKAQAKTQTAEIWESEARAIRTRADRLQDENSELTAALREATSRTDLTKVMELLTGQMNAADRRQERVLTQVSEHFMRHEDRANDRHKVTMQAFQHLNEALAQMTQVLHSEAEAARRRCPDDAENR